jgi:hypothetical protein
MVQVNDVRPLPCSGDVAGGNLLGSQCGEGEGPGHGRAGPRGSGTPAPALHRNDLDVMAEIGRPIGQRLDHALHATRARPIVLCEVQNAHRSRCPRAAGSNPSAIFPLSSGNFTRHPNRCQPENSFATNSAVACAPSSSPISMLTPQTGRSYVPWLGLAWPWPWRCPIDGRPAMVCPTEQNGVTTPASEWCRYQCADPPAAPSGCTGTPRHCAGCWPIFAPT